VLAFRWCAGVRARFTYNTCVFGSWLLYIVIGAVLIRIAIQTPVELKEYSESGDISSLSAEYKYLAGPLTELDSKMIDAPSRFMCSEFCPCEQKFQAPWQAASELELNKYKRTKVLGSVGEFDYQDA